MRGPIDTNKQGRAGARIHAVDLEYELVRGTVMVIIGEPQHAHGASRQRCELRLDAALVPEAEKGRERKAINFPPGPDANEIKLAILAAQILRSRFETENMLRPRMPDESPNLAPSVDEDLPLFSNE
jgi:hypothetical protein